MINKHEFEEWNKRINKQIDKQRLDEYKRKKEMSRREFKANFIIFLIIATPISFLIWNGFSHNVTTVMSCHAVSIKKQLAHYSETDMDFETEYWSEEASDAYVVKTLNGVLDVEYNAPYINKIAYMSNMGFYSTETPKVYSDFEKEKHFKEFREEKNYNITVTFYNGLQSDESITNYNKCLDYQESQKPIDLSMFYGSVSRINY